MKALYEKSSASRKVKMKLLRKRIVGGIRKEKCTPLYSRSSSFALKCASCFFVWYSQGYSCSQSCSISLSCSKAELYNNDYTSSCTRFLPRPSTFFLAQSRFWFPAKQACLNSLTKTQLYHIKCSITSILILK